MNKIMISIIKMMEENEVASKEFKAKYRTWPFILWLLIGFFVGAFSILLPPGPDSPHFVNPSLKCLVAMTMYCCLSLKVTVEMAKK